MARNKRSTTTRVESYRHIDSDSPMRPDVGTQTQFKKKKPPARYSYDSSLSPALDWDGQNPAREQGEELLALIENEVSDFRKKLSEFIDGKLAADDLTEENKALIQGVMEELRRITEGGDLVKAEEALKRLKAFSRPFLNWAGKAERLSFDVPTLPLFVHERLSTKAIIATLKGHRSDRQLALFDLYGDPRHSVSDQVLKAYEYKDDWVNRMMLGDSLVVMNSLLRYEGLGGQAQMIYIDPPYGVKFGSNFQPFVRRRDVKHNDDEDMTREPEMVQAYRDTWELGLHSYLTYLRDRLLLSRELLHPSGSLFVQISDENLHHVREVMDEVFGAENFACIISFQKTGGASAKLLASTVDYLIWYARDIERIKYNQLYIRREVGDTTLDRYDQILLDNGSTRRLSRDEISGNAPMPDGKRYQLTSLLSDGETSSPQDFEFDGKIYRSRSGTHWKTSVEGLKRLAQKERIEVMGKVLRYRRFVEDFPVVPLTDRWESTQLGVELMYVVQTSPQVIQRCILMTTDPGDLVLDPTCGSGTTAYVAEQWGRRWITIDTSRVPLALARQRLLTATFPYYELKDEARGPAGGFVYKRKQNRKGEETGGIVPHITLKAIANDEPFAEEVLVDRPEIKNNVTRVTGGFSFEATIPTPVDWEGDGIEDSSESAAESYGGFVDRMLEVLSRSPILRLEGNRTVTLKNVRIPAKTLSLSAEALVDATSNGQSPTLHEVVQEAAEKNADLLPLSQKTVAIVFGPENGAVSEKLVYEAAREAYAKSYTHLYVIGFAIQPNARELIEKCADVVGLPATYVQATPDLLMGDLLKNMRSSQIFSVCGLPEIEIKKRKPKTKTAPDQYQVTLIGFDVFDPVTMEVDHRSGDDVPAWFLDVDYNGLCFHVSQAFFPRTGAWDNLKKVLKGEYEKGVWDHLAGKTSAPFEPGEHAQVAVKVIDDRGNELMVIKNLSEANQ
ncbi:MAG: site-specific DNA-methyltransferase [Blastocatellia bacterium]|nr:site-specific DNA-methyltransferase [Blastocatellia bacterium]